MMAGSILARLDKTLPDQIASMDAAREARQKRRRQDFAAVMQVLGGRAWVRDLGRASDKLFARHEREQYPLHEADSEESAFWRWAIGVMGGQLASFPQLTTAEGARWIVATGKDRLPADSGPLLAELGRFAALVKAYVAQP